MAVLNISVQNKLCLSLVIPGEVGLDTLFLHSPTFHLFIHRAKKHFNSSLAYDAPIIWDDFPGISNKLPLSDIN